MASIPINPFDAIRELARKQGLIRVRDLKERGIHPEYLRTMHHNSDLVRVARGTYQLAGVEIGEYQTLAEACIRVPRGVICLLTALRFHELTTENPRRVWMAVPQGTHTPVVRDVPIKFVYFSGKAMTEGIETHEVTGTEIRIYGVAKTIADCFKYRNKIGLDVAIEALREGWRERRFTLPELRRYVELCRVRTVIRPYLEALI